MSVIIKGMKLPKSCDSCDLIQFDDEGLEAHCPLSPYYRWCGTPPDYRPEGCRLERIPTPHGRLIDADKLIAFITNGLNRKENPMGFDAIEILTEIEYAPTIIEAEASKQ